jgi:hypothetical protein
MHDWEGVASKGFAAIFRAAEVFRGSESKDCQM